MSIEGKQFRVFIASPGDVAEERRFAQKILDEINRDPLLPNGLRLESILWEEGAMFSTVTPQQSVIDSLPRPSVCDLVVFILWGRMGTPLPVSFDCKPDGSPYLSGTEWEYEDARQGYQKNGKPEIIVFRRIREVPLNPDETDAALENRLDQLKKVKAFFATFAEAQLGYNQYSTPDEFSRSFERNVKFWINKLATTPPAGPTPSPAPVPPADPPGKTSTAGEVPAANPAPSLLVANTPQHGESAVNNSHALPSDQIRTSFDYWRQRLRFSVREWERIDRNEAALLRGKLLDEALDWYRRFGKELQSTEQTFIEQSMQAAQRERLQHRLSRWSMVAALTLAIVLLLAVAVPFAYERILFAMASSGGTLLTITGASPDTGKPVAFEQMEVTNRRYALCVSVNRCQPPAPQFSNYGHPNSDNYPVTGIDAYQAYAFCRWIGRRLPSAAEWIYVATQGGEYKYPWGDQPPEADYANLDYETGKTPLVHPVGSAPARPSRDGVMDLIGNVSEWTRTIYSDTSPDPKKGPLWSNPDQATYSNLYLWVAGGSYSVTQTGLENMESGFQAIVAPGDVNGRNPDQGFRCVSDLP